MATAIGHVPRHAAGASSVRWRWPSLRRAYATATSPADLHLVRGERVLLSAQPAHGVGVVGTHHALYWHSPGSAWMRLGWEEVGRLDVDRASGGLLVIALANGVARRTVVPLSGDRRFVALAQERIDATRVIVTHVAVDGREVRVEARRQPVTGRMHWFVQLPDGIDVQDPDLPGKLDRATVELRAALGI